MRFHILLALWAMPTPIQGGFDLPNGWKITPAGRAIVTEEMVPKVVASPDGRAIIALHSGFNPHGLVLITRTRRKRCRGAEVFHACAGSPPLRGLDE